MRRRVAVEAVAVLLVGLALSTPAWFPEPRWTPDGIQYEARTLEFGGTPTAEASREAVLIGHGVRHKDGTVLTAASVTRYASWYRRRALLPAVAAVIRPWAGTRALLDLAIGSYVLLGVALFLLLRVRFALVPAAIGALAVMVFPPLRDYGLRPLTDGAGLLMVVLATAALVLTIERSRWWLALWVPVIALGSITRESILVPIVAAAVLALSHIPNAKWLLFTALAAAAPAILLLPSSYWQELSIITAGDFGRPVSTSFTGVFENWIWAVVHLPSWDLRDQPHGTVALVVALIVCIWLREPSTIGRVMLATLIGSAVYLAALPNPTNLRLEYVLLPIAAFTLAALCERGWLTLSSKPRAGGRPTSDGRKDLP